MRCDAVPWVGFSGRTHANLPAVCLVTAAAMPPLCFAFFLSFLAVGET